MNIHVDYDFNLICTIGSADDATRFELSTVDVEGTFTGSCESPVFAWLLATFKQIVELEVLCCEYLKLTDGSEPCCSMKPSRRLRSAVK